MSFFNSWSINLMVCMNLGHSKEGNEMLIYLNEILVYLAGHSTVVSRNCSLIIWYMCIVSDHLCPEIVDSPYN